MYQEFEKNQRLENNTTQCAEICLLITFQNSHLEDSFWCLDPKFMYEEFKKSKIHEMFKSG